MALELIKMSKPTTIRFNEDEEAKLKEMGSFLGIDSQSAVIKTCLPWATQRLNRFLDEFEDVIQPLKSSEIDSLISTMKVRAKLVKKQRSTLKRL